MPTRPPQHRPMHADAMDRARAEDKRQRDRAHSLIRGNRHAHGYTNKWDAARKGHLSSHPLCVICQSKATLRVATCVDHVIPHRGDMAQFWDSSNWQSLCASCHSRKTAKEDGGFGNRRAIRKDGG